MMSSPIQDTQRWDALATALRKCQTLAAAGQFATAIVHEINNPLEAVSNLNYLLEKDAADPTKVRDYSHQIAEQLATVFQIARRTLNFHRPSEALEVIEMVALTEAVLRIHRDKILAKQLELVTDIAADATVHAHAGEILQVLSNLLSNAIDALPANGKLTIRVRKCEKEVHLTVADEGHGIPSDTLKRIFEPFFTTKKNQGTGLGLAISKSVIERHKGKIRARSSVRPGRSGTAFRVSLPRHQPSQARG